MGPNRPSDELLNAFIDGELCPEERLELLRRLAGDAASRGDLCDLQQVKEMVSLAYQRVPAQPARSGASPRWRRPRPMLAASVAAALLLGALGLGVTQYGSVWERGALVQQRAQIQPLELPAAGQETLQAANLILLHVTRDDAERLKGMLDEAEMLLEAARSGGAAIQIQVIANGEGLSVLRRDTSPFPERIAELASRYPNLTFTACLNTIQRLHREEGIQAELLPAVQIIRSGVAEVVRRQIQGWAYIQV
jgi:uncharacterized protein